MKKQTFIKGALILTIGGFVAKLLGALYKIPLTNILGSSGMGLYYLVFPLYNLLLVCSSSGVSIAVTKLVANAQSDCKSGKEYLKAGGIISAGFSLLFSAILFLFAKQLAIYQGNELSYLSFVVISPAIVFSSLVAVLKAYFQGIENMTPSTYTMIIEQVFKMIVGLVLAIKLLPFGIEYAVMGAVIGVTISEAIALIILIVQYLCHKRKTTKQYDSEHISLKTALKRTMAISFPNTLMSLVIPLIGFIDSFMVVNLLVKSGFSLDTATSLYGINNGVVSSLISLPVIITSALSTAIVPNLSGLSKTGNNETIAERIGFFLKITWLISLPIFLFFFVMSDKIILALYNFENSGLINEFAFASKLLLFSSISIIYNAMLSTLISVLQVLNRAYRVFLILLGGMVVRAVLSFFLLQNFNINIFGVVIANLVFLFFCVCCCILSLKSNIPININVNKFFIIPICVALISGISAYFVSKALDSVSVWINLFCSGIVLISIYGFLILVLRCFENSEQKYLPFLRKK